MKRTPAALALLAVWVVALVLLGWFVQRQLVIGADLRLFLPNPVTAEQRLLLDEIGEGPASRVLVVALAGADAPVLADVSRALVETLQESPSFRVITNGEVSLDDVPDELLPYRFLLSPTLDTQPLDEQYLHGELLAHAISPRLPAHSSNHGCRAIRRSSCSSCCNAGNRWRSRVASSTCGSITTVSVRCCSRSRRHPRSIRIVSGLRSASWNKRWRRWRAGAP
jgi:hypothetical protein